MTGNGWSRLTSRVTVWRRRWAQALPTSACVRACCRCLMRHCGSPRCSMTTASIASSPRPGRVRDAVVRQRRAGARAGAPPRPGAGRGDRLALAAGTGEWPDAARQRQLLLLREQWAFLLARLKAPALAVHARPDEIAASIDLARLGAAELWFDLSPEERLTAQQAADLLAEHTRRLAAELPLPGQPRRRRRRYPARPVPRVKCQRLARGPSPVRPGWAARGWSAASGTGFPAIHVRAPSVGADDLYSMIRLLNGSDNRRKGN